MVKADRYGRVLSEGDRVCIISPTPKGVLYLTEGTWVEEAKPPNFGYLEAEGVRKTKLGNAVFGIGNGMVVRVASAFEDFYMEECTKAMKELLTLPRGKPVPMSVIDNARVLLEMMDRPWRPSL